MLRGSLVATARGGALARAIVAALVVGGCAHTHHVAEPTRGEPEHREEGSSPTAKPGRIPPRAGRPAVAASPEGLMNPGSARKIQEALRTKNYLRHASGELDEATSTALRRFQHDQGLAETGAPDRETLTRLGIDPQSVYRTATSRDSG